MIDRSQYFINPIENCGLIGNMNTAALVGMDGSIEVARVFSTPTYFWKVPDNHDYERSYDNK
ncbi:MAG TPA: hypothetical protein VHU84_13310 [Lacipirellulaceae bacterium]|nr:hypothetical protein [Lacipirellulaceae bacterium]